MWRWLWAWLGSPTYLLTILSLALDQLSQLIDLKLRLVAGKMNFSPLGGGDVKAWYNFSGCQWIFGSICIYIFGMEGFLSVFLYGMKGFAFVSVFVFVFGMKGFVSVFVFGMKGFVFVSVFLFGMKWFLYLYLYLCFGMKGFVFISIFVFVFGMKGCESLV